MKSAVPRSGEVKAKGSQRETPSLAVRVSIEQTPFEKETLPADRATGRASLPHHPHTDGRRAISYQAGSCQRLAAAVRLRAPTSSKSS